MKEFNSSGFLYVSCFNNMARRLVKPPPIYLGLQFYLVSSQRKEGKKKVLFSQKVMFLLIVHKKRCAIRRIAQRKRIYNQNKRHHPSLEGSNSFERCSWTCLQLVFGILVWLCTSVTISFALCGCSLSFRGSFFLCDFVLQAALANDGQRVGFGIKNPVLQREKVIVREQQVQIPAQTKNSLFSSNWKCTASTHKLCCDIQYIPKLHINDGTSSWAASRGRQRYINSPASSPTLKVGSKPENILRPNESFSHLMVPHL